MTNPGPWTPPGSQPQNKQRFEILDMAMILVMIAAGLMFAIAAIFVVMDSEPESFMAAGGSLTVLILAGLGRVVIHMAQTLDRIAANIRDVRHAE
ncbi:hypothetical protein ACWGLC_16285 [Dietzia sp. NPDC055877]